MGAGGGRFPGVQMVKYLPEMQETRGLNILWRREWLPTPVLLPRESHEQRSLVGYSRCGCRESDTTEQLSNISGYKRLRRKQKNHVN